MVHRIDLRTAITTPHAPDEPSVDAVARTGCSRATDLMPDMLSLRDPRFMPRLVRRSRERAGRPKRCLRGAERGGCGEEWLGRNVDLAA